MSNKTILPKMIDKLIERLEELSDENMGAHEVVMAYEDLKRMNDILDRMSMNKKRTYRPKEEVMPTKSSYGIEVKQKNNITWL